MIFQFKLCLKQYNRRLGAESKVSISQNGEYIAFSDIQHNLLLFNRNRNTVDLLGKKAKPPKFILFCDNFVAAVEQDSSQLFVYSLKNCRLKKSISFSNSKINYLGYSKDRKLLVIQSKSNCIVCKLSTLTKQKVLSCSTSNFVSSSFTQDGRYLVNFFDDSSVIFWNIDTYTNQQTSNSHIDHITAGNVGLGKYIVVACDNLVYIANYIKDRTKFEKIAEVKGSIENLSFINHYLVIQSTYGLYIGSVYEDHKISAVVELMAVGVKLFQTNGDYLVTTNLINDIIVTKGGRDVDIFNGSKLSIKQIQNNLLDNVGFYCAGGFDNRQGCICNKQSFMKSDAPPSTHHYLQKLYKSALISIKDLNQFSREKLAMFLLKRNRFVDKHRAITYQYLLNLPLNVGVYKDLVRKGLNPEIKHIRLKYPIKNQALFSTFEFVLSLLSHYCPQFADIEYVPALVFPLILAFGQDQLFCFEIALYFLTYWMNPLFETYPEPNVDFIYAIEQIIKHQKPTLITYFRQNNLPLSHIIWFIYSTFFTQTFNRNNYMSMLDTLICFNQNPSFVIFEVAGYILYNSKLLCSIKGEKELFNFISKESNEDCDKLMRFIHNLNAKYKDSVKYQFKNACINKQGYKKYIINRPEAVLYQRQRRRAEERTYIDMKRENDFYEEQLVFQQKQKIKDREAENKQTIRNEIFRYRDTEFQRRKFEEVNSRGKLELIEHKEREIPTRTHSHVPYSFVNDVIKNSDKGCCTKQRFFEKTRDY